MRRPAARVAIGFVVLTGRTCCLGKHAGVQQLCATTSQTCAAHMGMEAQSLLQARSSKTPQPTAVTAEMLPQIDMGPVTTQNHCPLGEICYSSVPSGVFGYKNVTAQCKDNYTDFFGFPNDRVMEGTGQKVALVGDSITAGSFATILDTTYPSKLATAGSTSYTNLGWAGTSLLSSSGCYPYSSYSTYPILMRNRWDVIVVMLGTNDAKTGCWPGGCGTPAAPTLAGCAFYNAYAQLVGQLRNLGPSPGQAPRIFINSAPPLMEDGTYTMQSSIINGLFPRLIPMIARNLSVEYISVFDGMDGPATPSSGGCPCNSTAYPCAWFCGGGHCDQCHPNDSGYSRLAEIVKAALL